MRRLGQGLTAAVAIVALVAALTGVCPCAEPARSAEAHDCCATPAGFRAAVDDDCCSSPGDAPLVVSVPCVHLAPTPGETAVPLPSPLAAPAVAVTGAFRLAASAPSILRI